MPGTEEPLDGDPTVICEADRNQGILMSHDCGIAGSDGGFSHWLCGETEEVIVQGELFQGQ